MNGWCNDGPFFFNTCQDPPGIVIINQDCSRRIDGSSNKLDCSVGQKCTKDLGRVITEQGEDGTTGKDEASDKCKNGTEEEKKDFFKEFECELDSQCSPTASCLSAREICGDKFEDFKTVTNNPNPKVCLEDPAKVKVNLNFFEKFARLADGTGGLDQFNIKDYFKIAALILGVILLISLIPVITRLFK